jgi:hypothetical protein
MKRESVVRKNLDLLDEFMKYAFDHPQILDAIPRDRTLVILPEGARLWNVKTERPCAA